LPLGRRDGRALGASSGPLSEHQKEQPEELLMSIPHQGSQAAEEVSGRPDFGPDGPQEIRPNPRHM
jgi:hypothetical protein